MNLSPRWFLRYSANVFAENRLLKLCCLVMAGATVWNSLTLSRWRQQHSTLVIPTGCEVEYRIGSHQGNDAYLVQMLRTVLDLRGNLQPANVRSKFHELLRYVHPAEYGRLQQRWLEEARTIEQFPSVSYFLVLDEQRPPTVVDRTVIHATATRHRLVGDKVVARDRLRYRLHYRLEQGRFWLTGLEETPDHE